MISHLLQYSIIHLSFSLLLFFLLETCVSCKIYFSFRTLFLIYIHKIHFVIILESRVI